MDYYQGVVTEYIRADRSMFVNTEYCLQLEPGDRPAKGKHWYCDAVATDFRRQCVYLCEISFSKTLAHFTRRLANWNANWDDIRHALVEYSAIPGIWNVRPWLFVPEDYLKKTLLPFLLETKATGSLAFQPLITTLEMVQPWKYRSWDRQTEEPKPEIIPEEWRV